MRRRVKQTVFVAKEFDSHVELTNGALISKEDVELLPYIYTPACPQGYTALRGNWGKWKTYTKIHRVIAERMGLDLTLQIDHINNIKTDNRRENLQALRCRENSTKDRKGTSKYYRVSLHRAKNKWRVAMHADAKKIEDFGYYADEVEAAYWSDVWAVRILPEGALLNFPDNINLYLEEALLMTTKRPWKRPIPTLEKLYEPQETL